MTEEKFNEACINLAAFVYGAWNHYYTTKEEFWETAVPESTKKLIRDFVSSPKEGLIKKHD